MRRNAKSLERHVAASSRTCRQVILSVGAVAAGLFAADSGLVESHAAQSADRNLALDVHADLPQGWHGVMSTLSFAGGNGGAFAVTVATVLALLVYRFHRAAIVALGTLIVALGLESLFKQIFQRPRPHLWSQAETIHSFSFPSGHATGAGAVSAALIWIAFRYGGRAIGFATAILGMVFAFGVGLSRVYLGVHWPSDVLGGYALAAFSVSAVILVTE